jgi:hypothetical protein
LFSSFVEDISFEFTLSKFYLADDLIIKKNFLVKQHCEVFYINTFFNLFDNENKIELLKSIRQSISMNIIINNKNEKNESNL